MADTPPDFASPQIPKPMGSPRTSFPWKDAFLFAASVVLTALGIIFTGATVWKVVAASGIAAMIFCGVHAIFGTTIAAKIQLRICAGISSIFFGFVAFFLLQHGVIRGGFFTSSTHRSVSSPPSPSRPLPSKPLPTQQPSNPTPPIRPSFSPQATPSKLLDEPTSENMRVTFTPAEPTSVGTDHLTWNIFLQNNGPQAALVKSITMFEFFQHIEGNNPSPKAFEACDVLYDNPDTELMSPKDARGPVKYSDDKLGFFYTPLVLRQNGARIEASPMSILPGNSVGISADFDTFTNQYDYYNSTVVCPAFQVVDRLGEVHTSICRGWQVTHILVDGKHLGVLSGPGSPPAQILPHIGSPNACPKAAMTAPRKPAGSRHSAG